VISTRAAGEGDLAALRRLRAIAREEARGKKGGALFVDELDALHAEAPGGPSEPPPRTTLVGLIGDAVVAYAEVSRTGRVALIEELYCEPGARRVGVGDRLVAASCELASSWGCTYVDSVALPGDRDTKNFFEAHAMVSRLLRVSRELS
jgi:GNAT superfamily N-acetyltransferase